MQLYRAHSRALGGLQAALGLLVERLGVADSPLNSDPLESIFQKINLSFGDSLHCANLTSLQGLCHGMFRDRTHEPSAFGICDPFAKLGTPHLHLSPVRKASVSCAQQGSGRVVLTAGYMTLIFRTKPLYKIPYKILEIWQSASNLIKIP